MALPNSSFPTALAHAVLSFSSAWAIFEAKDCIFARIGFIMYLINGLLGIVSYGFSKSGLKTYKMYYSALDWSLSLSLPLFVCEIWIQSGLPKGLAAAQLVIPVVSLLSSPVRPAGRPSLRTTSVCLHAAYLLCLLCLSIRQGHYYGVSSALSFFIALYVIGPSGMVQNAPSRDLFNYALSFSIYFLVQTINSV